MVQSLSRDAYGGFQEMVIANPVRARYLREMRQGSGEKAMSMEPTNRLRWVKRKWRYPSMAMTTGFVEREMPVLQQLWREVRTELHAAPFREEWRDVPTEEE